MEEDPAKQISLGVILEYAQFLVPVGRAGQMAGPQGTRLVRLLSWAQNPYIKRHNIAFCLLCDHLAEINERLVASSHVATLAVPMPDAAARERVRRGLRRQGRQARATSPTSPRRNWPNCPAA